MAAILVTVASLTLAAAGLILDAPVCTGLAIALPRLATTAPIPPRRAPVPLQIGPGDPRHGTLNGYNNLGCREPCCRAVKRDYDNARNRRMAAALAAQRARIAGGR